MTHLYSYDERALPLDGFQELFIPGNVVFVFEFRFHGLLPGGYHAVYGGDKDTPIGEVFF